MANSLGKSFAAALFAAAIFLGGAARADPGVDMATLTCQDWIDATDDEQDLMVAWLRGYLSGRSSSTLYNTNAALADRTALVGYCQRNRAIGVISAMSQLRK